MSVIEDRYKLSKMSEDLAKEVLAKPEILSNKESFQVLRLSMVKMLGTEKTMIRNTRSQGSPEYYRAFNAAYNARKAYAKLLLEIQDKY